MRFTSRRFAGSAALQGLEAAVLCPVLCLALGCGASTSQNSVPMASGAAKTVMAAPVSGYVWDGVTQAVRPVEGVTGASSLGAPLYGGNLYTAGVASSLKHYALLSNAHQEIFLATLPSGVPVRLSAALSPRQQMVISSSGSAALVYGADAGSVMLLRQLPDAPQVKLLPLPAGIRVTQAAVADGGLVLIAAQQPDGSSLVSSLGAGGATVSVTPLAKAGGLAFLPQSTSALMADAGNNAVYLASNLDARPVVAQIAGASNGIAQPVAVAASSDGHWAVVANGQGSTIARLDLAGQSAASSAVCACSPAKLQSLAGNSVFQLTDAGAGAGPVWVFDGDRPKARVVFVAGIAGGAR